MRLKLSKEAKVGLLAIVSLSMLYFGFNFLKGRGFFSNNNTYYISYDNTNGLIVSNPVTIHGVTVGMVTNMRLNKEKSKVVVEVEVDANVAIPKGSVALLRENGLLGGMQIELLLSNSQDMHQEGDTLLSNKEDGMLTAIEKRTKPIVEKLDSTLTLVNNILISFKGVGEVSKNTLQRFSSSAAELQAMVQENRPLLYGTLQNVQQISNNLNRATTPLPQTMQKLSAVADSLQHLPLQQTIEQTRQSLAALQQVLEQANDPTGSMGALLHDKALYQNLVELSADLDKLLIDLRKNPRRYIKVSVF
ncbi:phospholipid/cholesterol/gamma-HCH transport system substrate-binding protein [Thermonema lapsum]|uniref:Phospholipid/cholesterol/gamma-HCH transport system substrate-binding protein n=1 Tax=Thermonema lapsum TaxID=28195 RepID=A0A846MMF5_9BACT|nr:MlaD family protein [Thermonema lapsum]NIK72625.1 phospholipid/cholesterol/gamma-HCH transport system substrate-binding protein [Thermonema lapsum]